MRRTAGFTLVEIMIVVAIIALLAVIALPSLLRARERTRRTKFVNALRVVRDACETYTAEHNGYPADVNRGVLPAGMQTYFNGKLDWTAPTPIGGRWDWDYQVYGFKAGVSVVAGDEDAQAMAEIDAMIDDGDLTSGAFQQTAPDRYTWIVED
ncbi:MAG: type II secretion system GspH family protein, partial [Verrucomicrobiota bacterium]|nr:type II secretion system GspH family protein [Verrucomicrobiota bacterium]